MPRIRTTPEMVEKVLSLRASFVTRTQIAEQLGIPLSKVKTILLENRLSIPMEERQRNAYEASLKKNPEKMKHMRRGLTGEVVERRSQSVREAYKDPQLVALKTKQINEWWATAKRSYRYTVGDARRLCKAVGVELVSDLPDSSPFKNEPATFLCVCGLTFVVSTAFDVLYGKTRSCGCAKSFDERDLYDWVSSFGVWERNDRKLIAPFELDMVCHDKKMAIEYCGLHWHGELVGGDKARGRHRAKMEACEARGYRLITVFADEWLERQEATKRFLESILGVKKNRLGARQCDVVWVSSTEARPFLEKNHLLGFGGDRFVALKYGGVIVALASFRFSECYWEWTRFCVGETPVAGAAQRLLKAFCKECNPLSVVTYSDLRWSEGALYKSLGFEKLYRTPPSYWYFKKNYDFPRHHKSSFRKKKLLKKYPHLSETSTEWKMCKELGYDRIWDCGKEVWRLSFS